VGGALPAKVVSINMSKLLIVLAAFLAPIAVAAGVAGGAMLESPRTLAVALGAAWAAAAFVGYGFYGGKRCIEAATLLLVVALVVIVAYARPWAGGGAEENVVFLYTASFTYENFVDNQPIENIIVSFPCPNIDNEPVRAINFSWFLWWMPKPENENMKILQIQDGRVDNLLGNRIGPLFIQYGVENTDRGPKISLLMDKLYPQEVIQIQTYVVVSSSKSNDLTISENKEDKKVAAGYQYDPSDKKINFSFRVQLLIKLNNDFRIVEEFRRAEENAGFGWWWLNPISNR
jgi:hypothetical protein